jgi:hypothetical protein
VITFRRPASPMQFVLFPMVHFGTQGFYKAVSDRLRGCQLVVAEGGRGGSATTTLLGMSCRLLGTRRVLGRYLATDDLPTHEQELEAEAREDFDKVVVHARDALLVDALTSIHEERSAEPISVAVLYGAGHMPAVASMLVSRLGYHARAAEWLTVFDYS